MPAGLLAPSVSIFIYILRSLIHLARKCFKRFEFVVSRFVTETHSSSLPFRHPTSRSSFSIVWEETVRYWHQQYLTDQLKGSECVLLRVREIEKREGKQENGKGKGMGSNVCRSDRVSVLGIVASTRPSTQLRPNPLTRQMTRYHFRRAGRHLLTPQTALLLYCSHRIQHLLVAVRLYTHQLYTRITLHKNSTPNDCTRGQLYTK